MTQKTSQLSFSFHNVIVYCQQKAYLTELVSNSDLIFHKNNII